MAELLGDFKHKMVNNSFTKDADGTIVAVADFEGTAGHFGAVLGTLRVPLPNGPAEKGSCTWIGQAFPENLPWVVGTGDGTWAQVAGKNRWKFHFPSLEVSDGSRLRCEGELDLATRVFAGQMFDAS